MVRTTYITTINPLDHIRPAADHNTAGESENIMITNIIIQIIIVQIEHLNRREQELNRRIAAEYTQSAKACYLTHRRDATAAEKVTLNAMLRVYLASGRPVQNRRRAT